MFQCSPGALGLRDSASFPIADIARFEARPPSSHRDAPHLVAYVGGRPHRLPISVAEDDLALAISVALNDMLERARRTRSAYR